VAVGGPAADGSNSGGSHPVVVTSANGQSWTAADAETAFDSPGSITSAVTARQSGYVIVGHQTTGGRTIAAAWYSAGLTGWQSGADARPGALDGSGNRQMNAVAATGKGFAAVGSADGHPAAWQSATGRTWSETTLPLPASAASATLQYAAANGSTVAAIGTATTAGGTALPFGAVSANGGATWTETLLPTPKETAASGAGTGDTGAVAPVTALTAAGGGFTATGTYGASGAQDVVVWLLDRGAPPSTTWTMATPAGTGLAGSGSEPHRRWLHRHLRHRGTHPLAIPRPQLTRAPTLRRPPAQMRVRARPGRLSCAFGHVTGYSSMVSDRPSIR
jgi:hypothetical protein